jgi:arylsulfatase A-like enzyme
VKPVLQLLGFPSRFMDHGAAEAVARLERYLRNVPDDGRPQFVFVNLLEPHWQYLPPLAERLAALPPGLGVVSATRISSTFDPPIAMATKQTDPMTQTAVRALYAAGVRYEDERFAELLDALDRRLDPENTLLIVTADHGENLGEGGRYDHVFALNDHLIHVPLLLRYPKQIPSGREDGLCSQLDVSATLQDVVPGLSLSPSSDVRSLLPGKFTARSLVFAAGDPYLGHLAPMADSVPLREDVAHYNRVLRAVRGPRFKYVESSQDAPVLYDMEKDPNELKDVSAENPGVADALRRQLRAWEAREPRYEDAGGATDRRAVGAKAGDALEALRALGYVQ